MNAWAWRVALVLAWCWTWRHLAMEWNADSQYFYGWGVPVLALWMARDRWCGPMEPKAGGTWTLTFLAGAFWVLGELLRRHDPLWRLTGALLQGGACLLTVAWILRKGGCPLTGRLLFPLAFSWIALPWPVRLEQMVTGNLLTLITGWTTGMLNALGVPALQRAAVIELESGFLGMETACSGVQSFQAALMAALFFGEFHKLKWMRRFGLLFSGMVLAVFVNFLRVMSLALLADRGRTMPSDLMHDVVGFLATGILFAALLLVASLLRSGGTVSGSTTKDEAVRPVLRGGLLALALVLVPLILLPMMMARSGNDVGKRLWVLDSKGIPTDWKAQHVDGSRRERALLRYSEREAIQVNSIGTGSAQIIHLFWKPGSHMPALAFYHSPALCMPWSGWKATQTPQPLALKTKFGPLVGTLFSFEREGNQASVFQMLASAGRPVEPVIQSAGIANRLMRIASAWRETGKQVDEEMLVYLPASGGDHTVEERLQILLEHVLHPATP